MRLLVTSSCTLILKQLRSAAMREVSHQPFKILLLLFCILQALRQCLHAMDCRKQEAEFKGLDLAFLNPLLPGQGLPDAPTYGEQLR